MRRLLPGPLAEVDPIEAYAADRPAPEGRPWVLLNMVASIDGATAVDGASGGLGGDGDRAAFRAIRAVPDVILVAAGTVRAEGYGPPRPSDEVRALRRARGQAEAPRLAIVTGSVDLDPATPLFGEAERPPIIVTSERADASRLGAVRAAGAEVVFAGSDSVEMERAMSELGRLGTEVVLVEGGPSLNGQIVAADLVDEVCITIAPTMVAGQAARLAHGREAVRSAFELAHVLELGGDLCCRYVRAPARP
jgi:riboflavin-specific deaminase-like protein